MHQFLYLLNAQLYSMTTKQKLMLFLISCEPGFRDIYKMVKLYDRAEFPSNVSENLQVLLDNGYIVVTENFDNGTPNKYGITGKGQEYLDRNFDAAEIVYYIKTMDNPRQLLFITQAYIDKQTM